MRNTLNEIQSQLENQFQILRSQIREALETQSAEHGKIKEKMRTEVRNLREENVGYRRELERQQKIYKEMIVDNKEFMVAKKQFQQEQALLQMKDKEEVEDRPKLRYKLITCDLPSARTNQHQNRFPSNLRTSPRGATLTTDHYSSPFTSKNDVSTTLPDVSHSILL